MPEISNPLDSLLYIDVGSVNTRATLFDMVGGRYRLLATGVAPSTSNAPYHDVSEGVRLAIEHLQAITGRTFLDQKDQLIIPSKNEIVGVDSFAATFSAGPPLKIVAIGLLEDISLESVKHLAMTTYYGVIDTIGLNDKRKPEKQIDEILRLKPDLVLIAGGTDGGASQTVLKKLEALGLASYLMPQEQRPEVLFVGNQSLQDEIQAILGKLVNLHFAPNVRPTLDIEQLDAAQVELSHIFSRIRLRHIKGVAELDEWAGGGLLPTSAAFGRIIRYLSKAHASPKCVLGIDVGASATTIAAAFSGELALGVYPQFGLGKRSADLLNHVELAEIKRWIPFDVADNVVQEYLYNKSLYPASLPVTLEETGIEQALARQAIISSMRLAVRTFPKRLLPPTAGQYPWFEPVIASGSVLTRAPSLGQAMLMILDGVQPVGATTIVLDQNHITAGLGVAAALNPILTVQVLDSNAFTHLGTVVAPLGAAGHDTPILKVKMVYEDGRETSLETRQGSIDVLPLPAGQTARLHLQPYYRYDVGMGGPGHSGDLRVVGGALGVIIDGRGRPLRLPEDPSRRKELFKKWLWVLGN